MTDWHDNFLTSAEIAKRLFQTFLIITSYISELDYNKMEKIVEKKS